MTFATTKATAFCVVFSVLLSLAFTSTVTRDSNEEMEDASQSQPPPGTLYIEGKGDLIVSFDRVKVNVQITCKSIGINTASLAQTQNQESVKAFMTALEDELSISSKDLKLGNLNLHPVREYKNNKSYVIGYSASLGLKVDVSTEDKKLVPQISALASRFEGENTEVNIHGVNPYVSDKKQRESFEELFEKTMEDARFKAKLYAAGVDRKLGVVLVMSDKPLQVQSIDPNPAPMKKMMYSRGGGPEARAATMAMDMDNVMEMPLGEGQKLTKVIHLQYQLL